MEKGQLEQVVPTDVGQGILSKFASSIVEVAGDDGEGGNGDDDAGQGGEGGEGSSGSQTPDPAGKGSNEGGKGEGDNKGTGSEGDEGSQGSEDSTPLAYLVNKYGYTQDDEILKDLNLDDDSVEAIEAFYTRREEKVKQDALNELFENAPVVKDLIEHLEKGGSIQTWKEVKEAEELKLDFAADDVEGKTKFLVEVYKQKGMREKAAKLAVEALIDDNELDAEVTAIASEMKESKLKQAQAKAAAEAEEQRKADEAMAKTVTAVNTIIKQGKLSNAVIPDTERKAFNEFVLNGEALNNKYESLSLEQRLFIDYLVYKDFKVGTLAKPAPAAPSGDNRRVVIKGKSGGGEGSTKRELTLADLKKMAGS